MDGRYDAAVIGGGPGGYVAAIRLGQLGKKVALIEKDRVGGICLNRGCIPTKALLFACHVLRLARRGKDFGLIVPEVTVDLAGLLGFKTRVVERLVRGVEALLRSSGVEVVRGEATFQAPTRLSVQREGGAETIEASTVVIATGSESIVLPGSEFDGEKVINSDDALELKTIPPELVVIGAGAIGLEFATIYSRLGSKVRVLELLDQVLPGTDREMANALQRILVRQGIEFFLNARVTGVAKPSKVEVRFSHEAQNKVAVGDQVLVSVGRRPLSRALRLEEVGVKLDANGFVQIDERCQTSQPGIYAIGDVTGPPMFAHRASKQGTVAAYVIAGESTVYEVKAMPACVYTDPELASVGLSEETARAQGHEIAVGRFPVAASGRALTMAESEGMVKIIADAKTDAILGLHILAPEASNLIGEGILGIEMGAAAEDVELSVHPHPTLSEALMEAAAHLHGRAIHIPNR